MKSISNILFPAAVTAMLAFAAVGPDQDIHRDDTRAISISGDSVTYPAPGYKLRRVGTFEQLSVEDTLSAQADSLLFLEEEDSLPTLTARDTIFPPDSLKGKDPFRYKYYVALVDSATHIFIRDSLMASYDTLMVHEKPDLARLDSLDAVKIDSIYAADSTLAAKLAFLAWYNSLDKDARKRYDNEKKVERKMAEADSIRRVKEDRQAVKDSIIESTPRILETFFFPDSMYYKRIVAWEVDQDFHSITPYEPDTSYNYHFYDYPFLRKDVNASWLGMGGSPVQYYNYFNRESKEDIEFYKTSESWSFSPGTIRQYNTKTPHTELAYFGTLFGNRDKESDNLHLFTTQNITPEFNYSILYDLYGGGGILENEKTSNRTFAVTADYVGKKYMMNAGVIRNTVSRGENGGVADRYFIRDTAGLEAREIPVVLKKASSKTRKTTFFLDQQYRIPFNFITRMSHSGDSTYVFDSDSLNRDVTTAFIGHSSEFSTYYRTYTDQISDETASAFFNNCFNFNPDASNDSLGVTKLDNRVFLRLQPWSDNSIVSKLNVGVGDLMRVYFDSTSIYPDKFRENSVYAYGGVEGNVSKYFKWNAKTHYFVLGEKSGDFDIEGNIGVNFYPFRKARTSPVALGAHFETSLKEPDHYQQRLFTNHYLWENDFGKISSTKLQATISIPRWKFDASAGYALLSNNIYYDETGFARQNTAPMSVLSAYVRKEFVIGGFLHLDNRALFQYSSDQTVLPLPSLALNLRYFVQFQINKGAMEMQIGGNGFYNTQWYAPGWNPVLGVFHNQSERLYENGPYIDLFLNVQWKRACIFVKYQNFLKGWPMEKPDYFSADGYVVTQDGMDGLKIGIFWPFYTQPATPGAHNNH